MTSTPGPSTGGDRWPEDELEELLGLDPDPTLSESARRRIQAQLSSEGDLALDLVLGMDEVEVPGGLADAVRGAVHADRVRRRFRPVALVAAAAAAGVLVATGAGWLPLGWAGSEDGLAGGAGRGAVVALDRPSEELLAALPLLESLEFLEQELDSFEREIALGTEPGDVVFLGLLELGG